MWASSSSQRRSASRAGVGPDTAESPRMVTMLSRQWRSSARSACTSARSRSASAWPTRQRFQSASAMYQSACARPVSSPSCSKTGNAVEPGGLGALDRLRVDLRGAAELTQLPERDAEAEQALDPLRVVVRQE